MKIRLLCFITDSFEEKSFLEYIEKAIQKQWEVKIERIDLENFELHNILEKIDFFWPNHEEDYQYYFLSNITEIIYLTFRLYHQTFDSFLYYNSETENYICKDAVLSKYLKDAIIQEEKIFKRLYVKDEKKLDNPIFSSYFCNLEYLDEAVLKEEENEKVQKLYNIDNEIYIFEPIIGERIFIGEKNNKKINYRYIAEKNFKKKLYGQLIQKINLLSFDQSEEALYDLEKLIYTVFLEKLKNYSYFQKRFYLKYLEYETAQNIKVKIFVLSFLKNIYPNSWYTDCFLKLVLDSSELTWENKNYLRYQIIDSNFTNKKLSSKETGFLIRKIYQVIYQEVLEKSKKEFKYLKKEERNKDWVIVITSQFLNQNHGPTKTALDRCYTLIKKNLKKVLLLNTAEMIPDTGRISIFNAKIGIYIKDNLNKTDIPYKDIKVSYCQCENTMPNLKDMLEIVGVVEELKPYYIINIGGNSLASDLCSNIVPTITISTVPSGLITTEGQLQVIGRPITEKQAEFLQQFGKTKEHVITGLFTSAFKKQTHTYTRKQLKIPEDKFIAVIIGSRLEREVTDEFIEMLLSIEKEELFLVFIGTFSSVYPQFIEKYKKLKEITLDLGVQSDVLAILECCDLYLNPYRIGGGTSVAEAMYKGLPAVTIRYGDVALGAGEAFCVNDYQEMKEKIIQYIEDKEYYKEMSKKASERAKQLMDTDGEFNKILQEAEKRIDRMEADMD